jgi:S1-C subfamily serine protease
VADDKPGQKVEVTLWRAGKAKTVEVTLGERPAQAPGTP